ncbi:maltose ABC transporter permease MalF, partial [Glaesserella parasuis]|nr:maltose ABC transporter permease MalF [Glaesserella parasuis]MDE3968944.1 maltose ABC transporter permease MalF [Glaesserella parasuis]MDE3971165.1 maltose ABC transporter permease MalF [Glaesserella parasuis]MDE3986534.1 maltose ABC transporter permease MalF [Glaesserella parasuis]MDE4003621.1 maltose ABC transporter permease MalF [Glaesserella parasuis]
MLTSTHSSISSAQLWGKRAFVGLLYLLAFYLVFTIYLQGEILFALLTLVVVASGIFVFSSERAYRWRYLFPGISAIGIFVVFPLVCTVVIAFTNYSGSNQLAFERVVNQLQSQRYFSGERYDFKLLETADNQYQLALE